MVSVNEKCFLEKLACENNVKSLGPLKFVNPNVVCSSDSNLNYQTTKNQVVHNSGDYWDYHNNNCKHENMEDNAVGTSVNSCPIGYFNYIQPRKRIVWHNQVIDSINCILSQSGPDSSSHSSATDKKGFEKDVNCFHEVINEEDNNQPTGDNLNWTYSPIPPRERNSYDRCVVNKKQLYSTNCDTKTFMKSKVKNLCIQLDANCKYNNYDYAEIVSRINQRIIEIKDWVRIHQPKICLVGDSHTRYLSEIIDEMLPGFKIEATVRPGAKSKCILSNLKDVLYHMGKNDFLVTLSGTNDMWNEELGESKSVIYNVVMEVKCTNLLLCNVPNNYLEPGESLVQENITNFNQFYQDVVNFSNCAHLVNLHQLKNRSFFTRHGLHFNLSGKIKICELVANKIVDIIDSINT